MSGDASSCTRETLQDLFRLFDDGTADEYGSEEFLRVIAADCDWQENSAASRFAGRRGDREALALGTRESALTLRGRSATVDELIVENEHAIARWTWSATSAADGTVVRARVLSQFTVEGGFVTRWHDQIMLDSGDSA